MTSPSVLSQVVLGYSPVIDRQRAVAATRLTVFPDRPDAAPDAADAAALLQALTPLLPAPAEASADAAGGALSLRLRPLGDAAGRAAPAPLAPLSINAASESWLLALMQAGVPPSCMLEVPAFLAVQPTVAAQVQALHAGGATLLLKGRPVAPLPAPLLECFAHAVVDFADDRRGAEPAPAPGLRRVGTLQSGVGSLAQLDEALKRGAVAALGWPLDDPPPAAGARRSVPQDVQTVVQLIQGVDREEPVARLETLLKKDPALAFKLMRYLNSPAFGLTAEINSFGHALMMLGRVRLKRWLALLLASASKEPHARPLMYASVRRGLLLEELAHSTQGDAEMRGELFICGVFSVLDRLLAQPFSELLPALPVPERVQQALLHGGGPFAPYLALARAVEQASLSDIREAAEALFLTAGEVNHALLKALAAARQLD